MKITNRFDPTTGTTTPNNPNPQNFLLLPWSSGKLRVFMVNPTAINIDIYFSNGNIAHLPARGRRFFEEDVPSGVIYWQIVGYNSSIQTSTPPFTIELYEPYEKPPQIYPDVSPPIVPFGKTQISHFSGTGTPSITLQNVAGQTLVLDGWDLVMSAGSGTGSVTLTLTVTGLGVDAAGANQWKADYVALQGTALGTIDHQQFPGRGLPQAPGQNIVFSATLSATLSAGNNVLVARYHYEIPS